MTVRDYLSVLKRAWRLVAVGVLLGALGASVLVLLTPPTYSATTTFYISTHEANASSTEAYQGSLLSQERVKSYTELLSSHRLATSIIADGRIDLDPTTLADEISASVTPDTVLLTAEVVDASPERAQAIAASITRVFPLLVAQLERPADTNAPPAVAAQLVEGPLLAPGPVSPRPVLWIALGLVVGLLGGVATALTRDALDQTVRTVEDLRPVFPRPILAAIPVDRTVSAEPRAILEHPRSALAESVRRVRTNIDMLNFDHAATCFVVTSAVENEGKSMLAANLALAHARAGVRVLLVEGDLRKPRCADYLGLTRDVGLSQVIAGRVDLAGAVQSGPLPTMGLLASGPLPPNPYEMIESAQMQAVVREACNLYDVVLIDAPPLLPVADGLALARMADAVLVVVRSGLAPKAVLTSAHTQLAEAGVGRVGVVLNGVRAERSGYGGSYYGESADSPHVEDEDRAPKRIVLTASRNGEAPPPGPLGRQDTPAEQTRG